VKKNAVNPAKAGTQPFQTSNFSSLCVEKNERFLVFSRTSFLDSRFRRNDEAKGAFFFAPSREIVLFVLFCFPSAFFAVKWLF
jgi:hypothetical protein